jgi:hypothetical protein
VSELQIVGKGLSNWIARGGQILAGPYTSHQNAVAALRGVEARLRPVTLRRCLCCGQPITSTGRGHRLCPSCREQA